MTATSCARRWAHLLDTDPRVDLVATCQDGLQLAETVEAEDCPMWSSPTSACRRPATTEGVAFANRLRESHPDIGVVVVSQYADPRYGLALLDKGSDGRAYLLKDRLRDREHLIAACTRWRRAARWWTPRSSRR